MACNLTVGRKIPCKDVVGGIKAVFFINYGTALTFDSTDTDVVDDIQLVGGGAITALKYEVKVIVLLNKTLHSSRENGTTFFEQTLNLTLAKLTVQDH